MRGVTKFGLSLIVVLEGVTAHAASIEYIFQGLGTLGGNSSYGLDINNSGQVVGYSSISTAFMAPSHATLWDNGSVIDLHANANVPTSSSAVAINNNGQIVGTIGNSAVEWQRRDNDLISPTLVASGGFQPKDINDSGAIAGTRGTDFWNARAEAFGGNAPASLEVPQYSAGTSAYGINATGDVVGNSGSLGVRWVSGQIQSLGGVGGGYPVTQAYGLNDLGQSVGYVQTNNIQQATIWDGTFASYLAPTSFQYSVATGINNAGSVIGYAGSSFGAYTDRTAILWSGGTAYQLNDITVGLPTGWSIYQAAAINELGQIAGTAFNKSTNGYQAFVLTLAPVPEPETYAMLLAGLGIISFVAKRRRKA